LPSEAETRTNRTTRVVVATSVMLTFISFWRAAAIVLADLGSSAFYAGGIAEQAVGRAAAWFIFAVMLFSYAVRAVYMESCTMFTRAGVYRVVKEAMGGTLAKLSVSALMFDYILTGPISAVSAGQYIVGLAAQTVTYFGHPWSPDKETINLMAAVLAVLVLLYFWWRNTQGIQESSHDALRIMYIASAIAVAMILWSGYTILTHPDKQRLPPAPIPQNLAYNREAVGWMPRLIPEMFKEVPADEAPPSNSPPSQAIAGPPHLGISGTAGGLLGLIGILIAFGHSILAMSGEETLAQVNRELEYPKHKNLMRAGLVIFVYSLLFTSLVSFFAYAIIPDPVRPQYFDNLISGIAMNLAGPESLKLLFQGFIVLVGFLMLSGAVNTAIIGSNAVLNRVSEDGVLTDWFRTPHRKYGTSYRTINLIVLLQLLTIMGSRGNVYVLGEAYAFGLIWSFSFNSLSMLVLRFKEKMPREWKVPLNLTIGKTEIPIGLGVITVILFTVAGINLVTKQVATISGLLITAVFSTVFFVSERINEKKHREKEQLAMDQFRLQPQETLSTETVEVRPGNVLCLVRDYSNLEHLRKALELTHTGRKNLVVMTVHLIRGPMAGYKDIDEQRLFTSYEQLLFSRVVTLAEKTGKHVDLLVVPSSNVYQAIAQTAIHLQSSEIILGRSAIITPEEQCLRLGQAWEEIPNKPKQPVRCRVVDSQGKMYEVVLGAHAPSLSEEDIDRIHRLWLNVTSEPGTDNLHHKDIVAAALSRLERDLNGDERDLVIAQLLGTTSLETEDDRGNDYY
jgi:amino acid transporter